MGVKKAEFWRMTPLDFSRMRAGYQRRQEAILLPARRIEAALWNVQIAKTKDGKQISPADLYRLATDDLPQLRDRSQPAKRRKTHYNEQEMQALSDFFNQ